jgi:hypothetical protein
LAAHFPEQDVSGFCPDTFCCCPDTLWKSGAVMHVLGLEWTLKRSGPKCVYLGSIYLFLVEKKIDRSGQGQTRKKKEARSTFVIKTCFVAGVLPRYVPYEWNSSRTG